MTTARPRTLIVFTVMTALLVITVLVSAALGQLVIPFDQVLGSVTHKIGLPWFPAPTHPFGDEALWNVRFPRIAMSILVGISLAVAGALMQGIFGNPLAEPGTVGVSSGAAVGAALSVIAGWTFLGPLTTPTLAFVGGLITTFIVYVMSRHEGRTEVVTLILMGVAVNAVAGAIISFIVFRAPTSAREQIVFWQMGSIAGACWQQVTLVAPLCVIGTLIAFALSRQLDILHWGSGRPGMSVSTSSVCA